MGFTLNQLEQERQIRKLQKKEDQDTKDYEKLSNLPKINNVELKGNKTGEDLGITANVKMIKAWENQDPSVDFAAQPVTLSEGDYDLLVVIARYATTFGDNVSNISSGTSGYLTFALAGSSGPAIYSRLYSVNGNQVTFGDCEMSAHNAPTKVVANNTLIPYQIYKIKLT